TIYSLKFACIGSSVEVFQNVTSTILKREYIFYKTVENELETIAKWVMQNNSTHATISPQYSQKVFLENGTILLQDFQALDEGTYAMMIHQNSFKTEKVKLCALVPPNMQCKPRIEFKDNHLNASLNVIDCGRPAASVYWLGHSNQSVITVEPGKEAGPYHACIHSPSFRCVRGNKATDFCSSFSKDA
ncbi:hypothetical protein ACJMK2_026006, partial [Sinanodonta woodiana]